MEFLFPAKSSAYVLDQLRAGYTDLLRGTLAIKAYLASVVQIVEQRDAVIEKLGALETQQKIISKAVKLNEGAISVLNSIDQTEESIAAFTENMNKTLEQLEKIADSGE